MHTVKGAYFQYLVIPQVPWPYNICVNQHQIQVLTESLCPAWGILYLLPNNELGTK